MERRRGALSPLGGCTDQIARVRALAGPRHELLWEEQALYSAEALAGVEGAAKQSLSGAGETLPPLIPGRPEHQQRAPLVGGVSACGRSPQASC